jgi:hypothetical protein
MNSVGDVCTIIERETNVNKVFCLTLSYIRLFLSYFTERLAVPANLLSNHH